MTDKDKDGKPDPKFVPGPPIPPPPGDQSDPEEYILQFFSFEHLPKSDVSASFGSLFASLANYIVEMLPKNPERTVALRKLLEAKDAAVRAKVFK